MTLDEAIKIKTQWEKARAFAGNRKLEEADRLSIEALKRVKDQRDSGEVSFKPLPGETQ
jgi:hypothetical protein